ncbi:unnamed protein product [Prorocentrum cordatum]|uniref:Cellulase n=1 Tax=Prorocentrum cordatum TaxID=2364126 RepID=A0ABN9W8U9_9DINO|nr:unnamed protein product [Polarella glacialis]
MSLLGAAALLSLLVRAGAVQLGARGNSTFEAALALGSVWEFPLPADWVAAPPLDYSYGRCNYAAVTATNVGTGTVETGFIRYGIENHGSCADTHCGGDWGRFCMVKGGASGAQSTTGVDDFPYFNTWVHHSTPNCRTTSDSGWGGGCGGAVLTFWAQGNSGWETVYAWSGPVAGAQQTWTRTMTAGELVRVGFDAAGSNAPAPPPPTPAPTQSPTPSPTPAPTPEPTSSPTSGPSLLCTYAPRAVQMNTDTVPGDFEGTDDDCISGGGYSPPPTGTYFGHITADQFHGHSQKVGCLEFTLDVDAYIETRYGRHAAWSTTCPITIFRCYPAQ